jgi:hypothetical protein
VKPSHVFVGPAGEAPNAWGPDSNFWIGVVSRTHVQIGVRGGFIQLNHGKKQPLQRLRAGDGLTMYSPRTSYPDGEVLQSFTAIGVVVSGKIYQAEMTPEFKPYRVDVKFFGCHETPIRPLIEQLSFIKNKARWGSAFRFGQLKVPVQDFELIAESMGCGASDWARASDGSMLQRRP